TEVAGPAVKVREPHGFGAKPEFGRGQAHQMDVHSRGAQRKCRSGENLAGQVSHLVISLIESIAKLEYADRRSDRYRLPGRYIGGGFSVGRGGAEGEHPEQKHDRAAASSAHLIPVVGNAYTCCRDSVSGEETDPKRLGGSIGYSTAPRLIPLG